MTTLNPPSVPAGSPAREPGGSGLRLRQAAFRLLVRLRGPLRPRRVRREQAAAILVPGSVLVRARFRETALERLLPELDRLGLPPVRLRVPVQDDGFLSDGDLELDQRERPGLGLVSVRPGYEWETVRGLRMLARQARLRDVTVARDLWAYADADGSAGGAVEFTAGFAAALEAAGVDRFPATGNDVRVAVIDTDPDPGEVKSVRLGTYAVEDGDVREVDPYVDGHGTAVAAIIARVAPGAELLTVGLAPATTPRGPRVPAALIDLALRRLGRCDVVNVSWSVPTDPADSDVVAANVLLRDEIADILARPWEPILVFPTGNWTKGTPESRKQLAMPARLPGVVAVGSLTGTGQRAATSRYGEKSDRRFWMAPGGGGETTAAEAAPVGALLRLGGRDRVGTSYATAFASGLIALAVESVRRVGTGPVDVTLVTTLDGLIAGSSGAVRARLEEARALAMGAGGRDEVLARLGPAAFTYSAETGRGRLMLGDG